MLVSSISSCNNAYIWIVLLKVFVGWGREHSSDNGRIGDIIRSFGSWEGEHKKEEGYRYQNKSTNNYKGGRCSAEAGYKALVAKPPIHASFKLYLYKGIKAGNLCGSHSVVCCGSKVVKCRRKNYMSVKPPINDQDQKGKYIPIWGENKYSQGNINKRAPSPDAFLFLIRRQS